MSDDRISELEHRLIETSQSEMQREKKKEDIEQSIQELWGHFKRCHLCMVLEYQKEKQEQGRKKYLKLILVYVLAQLLSCVWLFVKHTRLPCPSPSPEACSNSCPLRRWCHQTILCHPLLLLPSIFPSTRVFFSESALHIRWPKYWSFNLSINPSNEYSGLISFRIDCFDLLAVQVQYW